MIWLDHLGKTGSLPTAWLIQTGQMPRNRGERTILRHRTTRAVLATQLGVLPDDISLSNDPSGRLLFVDPANELLHVSHATRDGMVLTAIGGARIGADIERAGAGDIPFAALHRAEQLLLLQLEADAQALAFAELWAVKEAHGKWAGTGLIGAENHPALLGPDGRWTIGGSEHVQIWTRMAEIGEARYALAVVGG